ncbi:MAG: FtsX-like permease family protein [Cellulosilyticaceae bacterium]
MGIKNLFLNTLRTFAKKKVQLLAIGIIIFLSAFLYTTMFYAMNSMTLSICQLAKDTNQEDFSIEVVNGPMPNERRYFEKTNKLEYLSYTLMDLKKKDHQLFQTILNERENSFLRKYPAYVLEPRYYKDIHWNQEGKGHTLRLFKESEGINRSYIENGRRPKSPHEIAVTRVYAQKNKIAIGDQLSLQGKAYTLTGYVIFSDMTLPMLGDDFILDNSKITTGLVTNRAYEKIQGEEHFYFAGVAKQESDLDTFQKEVVEDVKNHDVLDFITSIILTKNQLRSGAIYEELKTGQAATVGISIIISAIAVMIIAILTAKIVKGEKGQIGVLKALGYSSFEIAVPYLLLLMMIALPMLLLGHYAGSVAAGPMKAFYLDFYLLPQMPIETSIRVLFTAVGVPLIFTLGLSAWIIIRLLSKDTISLLKAGETEKVTGIGKKVTKLLRHAKVQTKYKYSFIFKNTGKFMAFLWGIIFASMLILLSFMMVDFFDKMTISYYQNVAYQYEGHLDYTKAKPKLSETQEKFLILPNAFYGENNITVKGLMPDNKLHKLYNQKGEDITAFLKEGAIVNKSFSVAYGAKIGDTLTVKYDDKVYETKLLAISDTYGDKIIYWNLKDLSLIATDKKSKTTFSGVYSITPLDKEMYGVVMNKQDVMGQAELMQKFIQLALYGMVGTAILIASLVLYILTTLTVEDNYYNISLLKVMGYSNKEVNRMILNSYLIYATVTYAASIPLTILGVKFMVKYFSVAFDMVLPLDYAWWQGAVGFGIVMVIFLLGTVAAKRKINRVPLQEVLKAYRE